MKVLSISGKKAVNIAPNANNVGTLEYQFGSQILLIGKLKEGVETLKVGELKIEKNVEKMSEKPEKNIQLNILHIRQNDAH